MASNKKTQSASDNTEATPVAETPVVPKVVPKNNEESVYTAAELAENHKFFNTSYEIVVVALQLAGKTSATEAEARTIIEKFKNREVK